MGGYLSTLIPLQLSLTFVTSYPARIGMKTKTETPGENRGFLFLSLSERFSEVNAIYYQAANTQPKETTMTDTLKETYQYVPIKEYGINEG
jgi:hypothetical protein